MITDALAKAKNASDQKAIDKTWGTYVYTTPVPSTSSYKVFIGNLYGGGNGEYSYGTDGTVTLANLRVQNSETNEWDLPAENVTDAWTSFTGLSKPDLKKTYLQLEGGVFGYVYGGGNNATVTESTDIYINNTTPMTSAFELTVATADKMGLQHGGQSSSYSVTDGNAVFNYQIDRVFGGNNKAEMSIQPHWYLEKGIINNLYSGGNAGNMTNADGIILNIEKPDMSVVNVYGGCRMADVNPGSTPTSAKNFPSDENKKTEFVAGSSARLYISAGKITNVYGGNDISGTVYGGTDVELHGAVSGDVYGGGNGSYVYTDKKQDSEWIDYYYNPGTNTLDALLEKRPNVQNSYVHIWGDDEAGRVYVTGRAFCGGNSATLKGDGTNPATATFKIGKYVTMNGVYLGSNGENMVTSDILTQYNDANISDAALKDSKDNFDKYMEGVEVDIMPTIFYDDDLDYTTQIGAFVCGGNKGSMSTEGALAYTLPEELVIFYRVVGGCNAANVEKTDQNPFHQGGVITPTTDGPKVTLNVKSRLEPRVLDYEKDPTTGLIKSNAPLAFNWNTEAVKVEKEGAADDARIFKGANIYGGCYESGYVNGDVVINIENDLISPLITNRDASKASYQIDGNNTTEADRTADVDGLRTQRDYIFTSALSAYGGGYGEQTEIWGDVTINLSKDAQILKVFGGGEQGIVGKITRDANGAYQKADGKYTYETAYNTTINLESDLVIPNTTDKFNVARVYGGGFQGVVTGNTALYLGGGKVSEAIAGAANADIYGCTEMFIGRDLAGPNSYNNEKPFVAAREFNTGGNVYGGNDFGGKIWGTKQHTVAAVSGGMTEKKVTSNTYVEYQRGLIGNSVYGGACGSYNYSNAAYTAAQADPDFVKPTLLETVTAGTGDTYTANTFVNVASPEASRDVAFVGYPVYEDNKKTGDHGAFFGGGKGYLDLEEIVDVDKTYVLLHATTTRTSDEFLTPDVYGGGYYSDVHNTMVDAYTGNFDIIYGGTFGATANQNATPHLTKANYQNTTTTINTYPSFTTNPNITIYGSGGYVGTKTTNVNLFGGTLGNVYGGSFNEGVCNVTNVNVMSSSDAVASGWQYAGTFAGSTVNVKALFGGSQGSADALPCDVLQSNVKFHSDQAYVRGEAGDEHSYIYGGNHDYRATEHTLVEITVPVRMASGGNLVNVCGAGYGAHTVAGFTHVDLKDNAQVNNVYGGGRDGKVLNQYDILTTSDPNDDASGYVPYDAANDKLTDGIQTYAYWTTSANTPNTLIDLTATSTVRGSMFGAGFGKDATVAGTTKINSYGTVDYYIYGGGYAGDVREMASTDLGYVSTAAHSTAGTIVNVLGGKTQKVYGGGSQGDVGALVGTDYNNATTTVNIGSKTGTPSTEGGTTPAPTYEDGVPTILLSAYGGGEMGKVYGTANVTMNNGYIGYKYGSYTDDEITAMTDEQKTAIENTFLIPDSNGKKPGETDYVKTYDPATSGWDSGLTASTQLFIPNLKASEDDTNDKLYQYGNLYGAGFGEGAVTLNTDVKIYGGTIRNSLYGGGEVAAVGFAHMVDGAYSASSSSIDKAGFAKVTLYEGNVGGSVFGGGRGYSYTVENGVAIGNVYYSDGYTFGQTEVNIHGGVIGTDESLALGEGNVFGGGNIGYVYSGSGTKAAADNATNHITKGYYYNSSNALTEDCKVVVSPYCKVTDDDGVTFSDVKFAKDDVIPADILAKVGSLTGVDANGKVTAETGVTITSLSYAKGEYVPTELLNTIKTNDDDKWKQLDLTGITVRNAVFAGGNVTQGSDIMYVEATTVFGNVSASVVDLYAKDFITLGNDDVGGLYGDGNLTFVDGYRELNISNYGTEYYNLSKEISYEEYMSLNNRQRAYFTVQYRCKETDGSYAVGDKIDEATYNAKLKDNQITASKWELAGFCSLYAGRMMNTIQRADFCGVFGSRMVLKGAQDRVPAVVDYTKYTINRVGEVSLNQVGIHGNYFGMYNVVNYLGALTSDVAFTGTRKTQSAQHGTESGDAGTYYGYKNQYKDRSYRNNGESANIVALASGVFLELVEKLDNEGKKVYGPITGVIQLDLISVKTGEGGGYVYAKNEHGTATESPTNTHPTLTTANSKAVTQGSYSYDSAENPIETSGNFVHSTKRIVDACYPSGKHTDKAHYWYIKGDYYVYDQYISAYTGSSNSYTETISLPLAIQAGANGKLTLENIQTSRYTYFDPDGTSGSMAPNQNTGQQLELNDILYNQNEPISYWDWSLMSSADQGNFLLNTYVCVQDFTVGTTEYKEGQVFTEKPTTDVAGNYVCMYGFKDGNRQYSKGDVLNTTEYNALETAENKAKFVAAETLFHSTNGVNSDNGLVLAVSLNNPYVWDEYHTEQAATTGMLNIKDYEGQDGYLLAPTYKLSVGGGADYLVYGQTTYEEGSFVPKKTVTNYDDNISSHIPTEDKSSQATFEQAYIAKEACDYTTGTGADQVTHHVVKGGAIPASVFGNEVTSQGLSDNFKEGYMCTSTVKLAEDKYLIMGETYDEDEYNALVTECEKAGVTPGSVLDVAYYCTARGSYGGKVYTNGNNFDAVDYTALNASERANFGFNWDALDVLSNDYDVEENSQFPWPTNMAYYDGWDGTSTTVDKLYSAPQSLDYTATYTGSETTLKKQDGTDFRIPDNKVLTNTEYESLLNEKANYVYLDPEYAKIYKVKENAKLVIGTATYLAGESIAKAAYDNLQAGDKEKVAETTNDYFYITNEQVSAGPILYDKDRVLTPDEYAKVNSDDKTDTKIAQVAVTGNTGKYYCVTPYGNVTEGTTINSEAYGALENAQMNFTITGETPVEKSVLYVTKDINPYDVTQDRIITVIYNYKYTEADENGTSFENIMERHVLNIHVHFESGVPSIGELAKPATILPGSTVGLNTPVVTPGAFEVIGGGFEVFENKTDAENQQNGVDWENFRTPMYWYQNDWYVAYYAETYLGKTYSNAVPFTVANYHSMEKVMTDSTHLYIDRNDVMRDCRIYLDNHECKDNTKNDLDYLKEFFDASLKTGDTGDNKAVFRLYDKDKNGNAITPSPYIMGGNHLQFYLNSDITASSNFPSLGTASQCFEGTLHGNGHTISGLTHSLFDNLCGSVYNLGVKGAIDGSGIAETGGYAENCWLINDNTNALSGKAVMGTGTIANCYFNDDVASTKYEDGTAIRKPMSSFLNGEVAYNLNRFYLRKRYADATTKGTSDMEYKYWALNQNDNTLTLKDGSSTDNPLGHYPSSFADPTVYEATCSSSTANDGLKIGYVENQFQDGDYIYANGKIPEKENERYDKGTLKHYPIYPDDYIFFGQKLTYNTTTHNATPTTIMKTVTKDDNGIEHERIERSNKDIENRVYRAPAYFRSKEQSKAYYNRDAAFVAQYTPTGGTAVDIHKGMTATDFTGYNDAVADHVISTGTDDKTYAENQEKFYAPWLDYEGLSSIKTDGLTKNLLAYAKTADTSDMDKEAAGVLNSYFKEPSYANVKDANDPDGDKYRRVADIRSSHGVKGHVVLLDKDDNKYKAYTDHYLVDKEDFNAPIAYEFKPKDGTTRGYCMWYQRKPLYATGNNKDAKGWEGVSLPFAAELVTTQDKGEITHFYTGSTVGHEYWLREYSGKLKTSAEGETPETYVANFMAPAAVTGNTKSYSNSFLYDWYYSKDDFQDKNKDEYQKGYYNVSAEKPIKYEGYAYGQAGVPYIAGFPGAMYYEFDLSGEWTPVHRINDVTIASPGAQTITFASAEGGSIGVSDDECKSNAESQDGYVFVPTYLNNEMAEDEAFLLNAAGSSFEKTTAATQSYAFRPYFKVASGNGVKGEITRSIVFGSASSESLFDKDSEKGKELDGGLAIYAKRGAIVVSSTLKEEQPVSITNAAGITIANFMIQPGETRITPIHSSGVYIVNEKKLSVK